MNSALKVFSLGLRCLRILARVEQNGSFLFMLSAAVKAPKGHELEKKLVVGFKEVSHVNLSLNE